MLGGVCDEICCRVCSGMCGGMCGGVCEGVCDGVCSGLCDGVCDGVCGSVCGGVRCEVYGGDEDRTGCMADEEGTCPDGWAPCWLGEGAQYTAEYATDGGLQFATSGSEWKPVNSSPDREVRGSGSEVCGDTAEGTANGGRKVVAMADGTGVSGGCEG